MYEETTAQKSSLPKVHGGGKEMGLQLWQTESMINHNHLTLPLHWLHWEETGLQAKEQQNQRLRGSRDQSYRLTCR